MDYKTEQDLIDRYASKRLNMPREDVEDLYNAFIVHFNKKVKDKRRYKMGFKINNFFTFLYKNLKTKDLRAKLETNKYKIAEEQLRYMLTRKTGIAVCRQ